ncbi:MAG: HD domain-containing protein [Anaerolineae bacterium]|nr:HD domain-containing protein [Thermoflexales bacterium]MDW8406375.1 HD domain-containing protein [Anaerolineae bacterium]
MRTKSNHPALLLRAVNTLPLIAAYFEWNQLKLLYRQGWLRRGLPEERCESVAEHVFSMAVLAMMLADMRAQDRPALDVLKILRLVLLHDFGEIYAGDITPADGVDPQDKLNRERDAIHQVLDKLPNGELYGALWEEYEAGLSPEARFVRQLDRLEMALQAALYERAGELDADEFVSAADAALTDADLRTVLDELNRLRRSRSVLLDEQTEM